MINQEKNIPYYTVAMHEYSWMGKRNTYFSYATLLLFFSLSFSSYIFPVTLSCYYLQCSYVRCTYIVDPAYYTLSSSRICHRPSRYRLNATTKSLKMQPIANSTTVNVFDNKCGGQYKQNTMYVE